MQVEHKRQSIYSIDLRPDHAKVGYFQALVHLIKANVGVGLFAMGGAYKNGGLYFSPAVTLFVAFICMHCMHQLIDCTERVTREYITYGEPVDYALTAELCFENGTVNVAKCSEKMASCINAFICITQIGFCCVYFIFISSNLQQVLKANGIDCNLRLLILLVWFPIWLSCLIRNLNALTPVSMAANILLIGSFIATIVFAIYGGIPDIDKREPLKASWEMAIFFGILIFAFEGIALVLPIRNAMENPVLFGSLFGVLNVGMIIVMLMYLLAGTIGYAKWGEDVKGSTTLNLGDSIFAQCVKVAVSLGVMFTYPLQFFVAIQVLLPWFLQRTNLTEREVLGELLFRTLLTICTVIIAEIIPKIGMFISLIGAFCSTSLSLIFPPILECLILHQTLHSRCIKFLIIIKNIFIIILGVAGFTIGTAISSMEIFEFIRESIQEVS